MRSLAIMAVVLAWLCANSGTVAAESGWNVINDTNDNVIIHLWPASESRFSSNSYVRRAIPPRMASTLPVSDKDPYHVHVQIETGGPGSGKYVFVPSMAPIDLHKIASNSEKPFRLRTALALKVLPGGVMAPEGTATFFSATGNIFLGDMKGFRAELERSSWKTTFVARSGASIPADLRLDVSKGTFQTPDFTGALSGIVYLYDGDTFIIEGRWGRTAESGEFVENGVFRFKGSRERPTFFRGTWSDRGLDNWREWNGNRR
jgi:hypothetical protein